MGRQLKLAIYAAGGGRGHGVRASGIASALGRRGVSVTTILPRDRPADDLDPRVAVHRLPAVRDRRDAARAAHDALRELRADAWVTDAFPDGPARELADLPLPPAVLLGRAHRDGRSEAFVRATRRYARVLDLEPHLEWCAAEAEPIGPVARAPSPTPRAPEIDVLEVADDPALEKLAHRMEGVLVSRGLRVGVASGGVVRIEDHREPSHPRLLDRVRPHVLIGPAGYHLVYEARAAGIPHLAIPRPRRFDLQARRAQAAAIHVRSLRELGYRLERLDRTHRPPPDLEVCPPDRAAAAILEALQNATLRHHG